MFDPLPRPATNAFVPIALLRKFSASSAGARGGNQTRYPMRPWIHAFSLSLLILPGCAVQSEKGEVRQPVIAQDSVRSPAYRRSVESLLGRSLLPGNRITPLLNGAQIFPAMLAAIRGARHTINFETYVYWSGEIGHQFASALAERARAGVQVRAILDWQGTLRMSGADTSLLRSAGVQLVSYHPLQWWDVRRVNNRTHRKLLIVDGKLGFIGGVGIADQWQGAARTPDEWRDTHYRVEGPVVAQLQACFMDNWMKARGEVLHGDLFFPRLSPAGPTLAQAITSSPGVGNQSMRLMFLLSIAGARQTIQIESPYFVPDRLLVQELVEACARGVRVDVIVPGGKIDSKVARATSRSGWEPLLGAGVKFYEFEPTMIHAKLMIIDGEWVSIGSSNFDNRSMRLNDEANLNVLDRNFAAGQAAIFQRDRARAKPVNLREWQNRPLTEKISAPFWEVFRSET